MEKRSLSIAGHRTSLALEPEFWLGLEAIARHGGTTLPLVIQAIDEARDTANLSSAVRLSVLAFYRDGTTPANSAA